MNVSINLLLTLSTEAAVSRDFSQAIFGLHRHFTPVNK